MTTRKTATNYNSNVNKTNTKDTYDVITNETLEEDNSLSIDNNITAPTNLKVAGTSQNTIKFTWSKVANVTGYRFYYKNITNGKTYLTTLDPNVTNITINNIEIKNTYYFYVRSYLRNNNTVLYSKNSNVLKVTYKSSTSDDAAENANASSKIKTPTNLKIVGTKDQEVRFRWGKISGVTGYQVKMVHRCIKIKIKYIHIIIKVRVIHYL